MRTPEPMSTRSRLVVTIVGSMVGLAVLTGGLVRAAADRNAQTAAEQAISAAAQALAAAERADVDKLDATLAALSAHPGLAEAFAARDRKRLLALAAPVFARLREEHDVTHFYVHDPERVCFLRVHRPEQFGDVVDRITLRKAVETGQVGAGKELGRTAFALRVVRPWHDASGKLLGYLELGEEIDHFLARIKAQTGDDYGLLVEKAFLDARAWRATRAGRRDNWDDRPRAVVVDITTPDESIIDYGGELASIPDAGLLLSTEGREHATFVRGIVPVKDAAGRRVGGLFVVHDITALHASMLAARRGIYAALALTAAVLAVILVALGKRRPA
jgi:hypothetical protein